MILFSGPPPQVILQVLEKLEAMIVDGTIPSPYNNDLKILYMLRVAIASHMIRFIRHRIQNGCKG